MTNGVIQLNFPWWYPFVKWLLPIGLAFGTALWVALSIMGIIPIPVSLGIISWAPVFFSQLESLYAFGALFAAAGLAGSAVGAFSYLLVRGLLLTTAENVATAREINAAYYEKNLQVRETELRTELEHVKNQLANEGAAHTESREELVVRNTQLEILLSGKPVNNAEVVAHLARISQPILPSGKIPRTRSRRSDRADARHAVPTIDISAANSDPQDHVNPISDNESSGVDLDTGRMSASSSSSRSSSPR